MAPARGQPPFQTTGSQEKAVYQAWESDRGGSQRGIGEKARTKDRAGGVKGHSVEQMSSPWDRKNVCSAQKSG